MSYKTFADVQREQATAAREAQDNRCVDDVFKQYPVLVRDIANRKEIIRHLREFTESNEPLTLSTFEFMLVSSYAGSIENYAQQRRLSFTTEERRKAALVDQIMKLIREHGPRQSEWDLQNEQKRLSLPSVTVQYLEDRLADIKEKQRLAKLSISQIQTEIRASKPQPQRVVLPAEFTVRAIKAMSADELRNLIRTYGSAACNDRLFGKS